MTTPLDGIRILDFTRQMAGPYGTLVLADYGADVIKVESLPVGDGSRETGAYFPGGESALFLMWNRGKRSIALDLRERAAIDVIERIVRRADVLVENYRPGVADDIGIGYEAMSKLNERLVYCSVSAFGPTGPIAEHPGTDPVIQAMSGVMSVTGEPNGDPCLVGVPIADFTGAMLCAQAVLLGLAARERTGRGQKIDVSMLYGLMSALTTRLASYWATGEDPTAYGSAHSVVTPYEAFRAKDGYIVAGVWGSNGWVRFCRAIDRPDLADDERYAQNVERIRLRHELKPIFDEVFAQRTVAEWDGRFRAEGALFGPVHTFSEILNHPQVESAGLVQQVQHATLGQINQLGPVIQFSETPGRITTAPPVHGQHTRDVLAEAGYSEDEIEALVAGGVAKVAELPDGSAVGSVV
jgi:crotonobetainyl-CoA:carnitine CoA-transferase CaiB-like acyl-CoA transferase